MRRHLPVFAAALLLATANFGPCRGQTPANARGTADDPVALADPLVGTDGGGNAVPGATVPFGFVWLSPDTTRGATSGYDGHGLIIGFSHTHVSGTGGGGKYGNFRVTPAIGADILGNLAFPRSGEQAAPGYYAVVLGRGDKRIRAELTASRRVGWERFTFPATTDAHVLLDATSTVPLGGGGPRATSATVTVADNQHVSGQASFVGGWGDSPYTLYFCAEFDRPARAVARWAASQGRSVQTEGPGTASRTDLRDMANRLGMLATFDTSGKRTVSMKLAVSFVSVDQARRTLAEELPGWEFSAAVAAAQARWRAALQTIEVAGGTDEQRRTFYSALYRSQTMPHDLTGENIWWRSDAPHYEDFYTLWDTFRTLHPLLTLIQPQRQRDMVRSLIDTWQHAGWLPDARIAGSNGPTQGGSNAEVVIADAIVKDLGGFDAEEGYRAIRSDADVPSPDPQNIGRELRDYVRLGYMPLDQTRSASRTLEYAYADFTIAEAATRIGHTDDAARFLARSRNWANLWDGALGCIHPRYADGRWLENFECDREYADQTTPWWDAPFYEGTSRQYSTFVPHDVAGLIRRLGGRKAFIVWLDTLFGKGGYTQGNEPDLLAPFLYVHAGRPDITARRVRELLAREYHPAPDGLPGNDDAGTLSSWYVWAALGLFPNAGQPFYYIASPLFARSTIRLEHGRRFTIEAMNSSARNLYVQSASFNGRPLARAWLTQPEIAGGGKLVLLMGATPSAWGSSTAPPE